MTRTPGRLALVLFSLFSLFSALGLAAAAPSASAGSPEVLLALGDSLASGYQPTDGRKLPPTDPATGLPDEGYPGGYAADLAKSERLRLVDLACPGETTASFSGTPAEPACRSLYETMSGASSQLADALSYLGTHKGAVRVVTIDLGANDVDGCLSKGNLDVSCVARGATQARRQLTSELSRLTSAVRADDPAARLVGMNYYDPFLGLAYDPGGTKALTEAALSVGAVDGFDAVLDQDYHAAGMRVADVASAFSTSSLLPAVRFRGVRLTRDVDVVCSLTWMCPDRSRTSAQDIHPNTAGYARIASAFEAVLRS